MTERRPIKSQSPASITVLSGQFASQPLVFAHLLDCAPDLDLDHVQVIQTNHAKRLAAYFTAQVRDEFPRAGTLVLILPHAFTGAICPVAETPHLTLLGQFSGTIPGGITMQ